MTHDFRGRKRTALVVVGLFVVSTTFPVVASLVRTDDVSLVIGWLDALLALALVCVAAYVDIRTRAIIDGETERRAYRAYRALSVVPLALLAVFFVSGERIDWNILLPGLAWRSWLFCYVLPGLLAALRGERVG